MCLVCCKISPDVSISLLSIIVICYRNLVFVLVFTEPALFGEMGLPQISSSETSENESDPLGTFVYKPEFAEALPWNASTPRGVLEKRFTDVAPPASVLGKVPFEDSSTHETRRNVLPPVSRIVGFNCDEKGVLFDELDGVHGYCQSACAKFSLKETENSGHVRKRMLSPLNKMLLCQPFDGDSLNIGSRNYQNSSHSCKDTRGISIAHDSKKANVGCKDQSAMPIWSVTDCSELDDGLYESSKNRSIFLTDCPVLKDKGLFPFPYLPSSRTDSLPNLGDSGFCSGPKSVPIKPGSYPLSSSPLKPRFTGQLETAVRIKSSKKVDILEKVACSLDESMSGVIFPSEEEESGSKRISFEDADILFREAQSSSSETRTRKDWLFRQDVGSGNRLGKNLRGFPVQRSLVGSFEESLLSGRLASGRFSQVVSFVSLSKSVFDILISFPIIVLLIADLMLDKGFEYIVMSVIFFEWYRR